MVTDLFSILNQMEFHLVQNRKENCHHDHIPFNVKRIGNIVFAVCWSNYYGTDFSFLRSYPISLRKFQCSQICLRTEKSFRNLIKLNPNQIICVFSALFQLPNFSRSQTFPVPALFQFPNFSSSRSLPVPELFQLPHFCSFRTTELRYFVSFVETKTK